MLKFSIILSIIIMSVGIIDDTFGHGMGSETLLAQNLGDKQVFIEINAMTVIDSDIDQQFIFQMFEAKTRNPIKEITYEIQATKQDKIIFNEIFKSDSGTLIIDFIDTNKEITIEKESGGIFDFILGGKDAIKVSGPYFNYGGLYQFKINVLTANSYSNQLNPPLTWDAGISLADVTEYTINDINFGEQNLKHTSYYDLINDLQYNQQIKEISFNMPFNSTFDSINQTSVIHEEIAFSKQFGDLMASEISATVNGVVMPEEVIQIDDFTENIRIVHLTMIKNNILELYDQGKIQQDQLDFIIGPSKQNDLALSTVTKNGQFKIIIKSIPSEIKSGQELEITYKLFDVFLKDRPVEVDYDMYVAQNERILFQTKDTSNDDKKKFDSVKINIPEDITGIIYVHFENLAGNSLAFAKLPIVIERQYLNTEMNSIPKWIKNTAGWWSEGLISDEEFVRGMEYLIGQEIIMYSFNSTENNNEMIIPKWIKNTAGWWSEGLISDEEFVRGMEYLISDGIIRV